MSYSFTRERDIQKRSVMVVSATQRKNSSVWNTPVGDVGFSARAGTGESDHGKGEGTGRGSWIWLLRPLPSAKFWQN